MKFIDLDVGDVFTYVMRSDDQQFEKISEDRLKWLPSEYSKRCELVGTTAYDGGNNEVTLISSAEESVP